MFIFMRGYRFYKCQALFSSRDFERLVRDEVDLENITFRNNPSDIPRTENAFKRDIYVSE